MNHAITRCPKCSTSFRITQNQLKTAKGAVRCGSCLTVFQAAAHLIQEPAPANVLVKKSTVPNQRSSQASPNAVKASIHSEGKSKGVPKAKAPLKSAPLKSPQLKDSTAVRDAVKVPKRSVKTKTPAVKAPLAKAGASKQSATNAGIASAATQKQVKQKVSEVDDILISDDMDGKSRGFDESTDEVYVTGVVGALSHSLFERDPTKRAESPETEDDDSWALGLLDDHDTKIHHQSTSKDSTASDDTDEVDLSGQSIYSEDDFEFHDEFKDTVDVSSKEQLAQKSNANAEDELDELPVFDFEESLEDRESDTNYNLFSAIEPEPVEFSYKRKRSFWRSRKLFAALAVMCMLGLIVQTAIMRFDTLALKEPYRAAYSVACGFIGCELPNRKDTSKIRINQLVVRSHPTTDNALIVDAVILNNATFEQGFPDLTLTFTDMQNKPIASRSFAPAEYLNGELKGYALMPSLQPITLNFQIVDPGAKAVNYLLTIAQ